VLFRSVFLSSVSMSDHGHAKQDKKDAAPPAAPKAEKKADKGPKTNMMEDFMLAGVAAGISKTVAAPIERVKLLLQNQGESIHQDSL